MPIALPRAGPSKVAVRIASEPGTSSAPVKPCRAREPISISVVGAIAHITEVIPNPTSPMMKMRRRPNWSPSAPPTSSRDTVASM